MVNEYGVINTQQGWICPKCQRVYAPWVDKCQYCDGSTITNTPPTICPYQWWYINPISTTTTTHDVTLNSNGINNTISATDTNINSKLTNEVKG